MKPRGSVSSGCLWFDGLSKHFAWDYPPVTGILSRTLYNTDNIIGFLLWVIAIPPLQKKLHHYLTVSVLNETALSGQTAAESLCLPAWIPTNCSLFILIYNTFSSLISSPQLSKYNCSFFSPSSLSFFLLPLHLFSPVALIKRRKKLLKPI